MLAWLITTASFALFCKAFRSSSIPMTNIKRISPIWLKNCKFPSDSFGNNMLEYSGKYMPTSDGPSTIPAIISPMTLGWPIFLNSQPKKRATKIMVIICANKIASGWPRLCCIDSKNSCHWPFPFGTTTFLPASRTFPCVRIQ